MSFLFKHTAPLAMGALLFSFGSAQAQAPLGGMVTGDSYERIAELAGAYGTIEQRTDEDGTRWLRGEMDDTVYTISFLNCDDAHRNCTSIQFRAWWESEGSHSMEAMNEWNRGKRFSAAYLDDENNATVEFDVNLAGGVSAVNFDDTIQWWQAVLQQFQQQVIDPGYAANPNIGAQTPSKG